MSSEQTLILVKPDGVKRGLVGEVIARVERKGYKVTNLKMLNADRNLLAKHYAEHEGKPFFDNLIDYMTSAPVLVQVLEGENAVMLNRSLMGATNPQEAEPGTIRADFAESIDANAVHGSDSLQSAEREIAYFFASEEICS